MYYNPFHYPIHHPMPTYPRYFINHPLPRVYPPVDVKIFSQSVKSFRLLMEQGSILLDRLGDAGFAQKMMAAAQQGKKVEVDHLIHSIGLKVPVNTKYTPTGVNFELTTQANQNTPFSCCSLTISLKWRN
jgi:hypothetical protein